MLQVKLLRVETDPRYGSFGILLINGEVFCITLEPYWRFNFKNVSCIPSGQYICKRYYSSKYGETFIITDIAGRTLVLFHPGNIKKHSKGCILLAQYFGKLKGDRGILNSGNTFKSFMNRLTGIDEFKLTIIECY